MIIRDDLHFIYKPFEHYYKPPLQLHNKQFLNKNLIVFKQWTSLNNYKCTFN